MMQLYAGPEMLEKAYIFFMPFGFLPKLNLSRFTKRIYVEMPDKAGRKALVNHLLSQHGEHRFNQIFQSPTFSAWNAQVSDLLRFPLGIFSHLSGCIILICIKFRVSSKDVDKLLALTEGYSCR